MAKGQQAKKNDKKKPAKTMKEKKTGKKRKEREEGELWNSRSKISQSPESRVLQSKV